MSRTNRNQKTFIQVKDLTWNINGKNILNNLNFSISEDEFVGVIGPNGAGKSSLLRCLYQKVIPSSGELFLDDKNLNVYHRKELAKKVAVVLQEPPSQFDFSVLDVIRMGLIPHKSLLSFNNKHDEEAILSAAKNVDLTSKLSQSFNSLSGGEKQRAMIARAILQSSKLLIMDEPTNHLDVKHQVEVLELARKLNLTVILSIHDLNLAATFCDRLIMLNHGQIVADGSPDEVLTQENLRLVFGMNASIDRHPYGDYSRITFDISTSAGGTA